MKSCELVFTLEHLYQNGIRHYVSEINKYLSFTIGESWYPKSSFETTTNYQLSSKLLDH